MNKIPIVFAFDNNLLLPACVCISSLMMNAKPDTFYDIFILYPADEKMNLEQLTKIQTIYTNCNIQYRPVGNDFNQAFEIRGVTTPTYYRLLIPELIPEYDKIIYSDVDVIFRNDLSYIYNTTNLEDCYLAGVNSLSSLIPEFNMYYSETLHLESSDIIYAGNLIINSKQLLQDNKITAFRTLARKNYTFQDMDIINIACHGKIKHLSPAFCLTNYINDFIVNYPDRLSDIWKEAEMADALNHGIVHYNGQKPWQGYCVNFDIWWEYYRKSPVFDNNFYFEFFHNKMDEYNRLPLIKRIKILMRYFLQ